MMAPFIYFAYSEQRKRTKLAKSSGLHGRPVGIKSCLGGLQNPCLDKVNCGAFSASYSREAF